MARCSSPGPASSARRRTATRAIAVLREAVASGVNHIDTSDYYGPHVTNQIIREALSSLSGRPGHRHQGRRPARRRRVVDPGAQRRTTCARGARQSAQPRPRRDGRRQPAHHGRRPRTGRGLDRARQFEALAELQRQGLIRHIGLSNVTARQVAEAQRIAPVVCVQNHYNLAHRDDDALIDALAEQGIAYVPFFPLGGFTPLQSDALSDIAAESSARRRCRWRSPGCCSARPTSC